MYTLLSATPGMIRKVRAGWFNIVGLFALTAGSGFLTAGLVEDIWNTAVNCNLTNADDFLIYSREYKHCVHLFSCDL